MIQFLTTLLSSFFMETSYNHSITNTSQLKLPVLKVKYCDTFSSRLRGFMFTDSISQSQGLVLAYSKESIIDTSIHMFFMNFDISVFWLDRELVIVDKTLARRWKPYYASHKPAMFVLEAHPDLFEQYQKNDKLVLNNG